MAIRVKGLLYIKSRKKHVFQGYNYLNFTWKKVHKNECFNKGYIFLISEDFSGTHANWGFLDTPNPPPTTVSNPPPTTFRSYGFDFFLLFSEIINVNWFWTYYLFRYVLFSLLTAETTSAKTIKTIHLKTILLLVLYRPAIIFSVNTN